MCYGQAVVLVQAVVLHGRVCVECDAWRKDVSGCLAYGVCVCVCVLDKCKELTL